MSATPNDLGRRARAYYAPVGGDVRIEGTIKAHSLIPMVLIEAEDGTTDWWRVDLVEVERPKWTDLFGIDPDYTDGKPVDEWLEEQRGEA